MPNEVVLHESPDPGPAHGVVASGAASIAILVVLLVLLLVVTYLDESGRR